MYPTRQFWRASALAVFLAVLAAVIASPVLLLAGAVIATVLGARQWSFYRLCTTVDAALDVTVTPARTHVRQDDTTAVTLTATLAEPVTVDTQVSVPVPLTADCDSPELAMTVPAGELEATTTAQLEWPTATTATFDHPTVTVRSRDGLFSQTIRRGATPTVVVEPRTPRNIHVGEGGTRTVGSFGAHRTGQLGQGIDPAELREYVAGDDVSNIDWKTTARQGEPYVVEYEVETDRRTVLLFDHSESTAVGQPGEQAVAYLREVALAMALSAARSGDPLALYTVDDEGLTNEFEPGTGTAHYRSIRTALHGIEAEQPTEQPPAPQSAAMVPETSAETSQAERASRRATVLAGEQSAFATRLAPYFRNRRQYVRRIEGDPLFDVARTYVGQLQGETQTILFTDDSDRSAVRETVNAARGRGGHVTVFLAPRSLFEEGGLSGLETAYDRYSGFESFRRRLASLERVSAYEVTPADRLQAVLTAGDGRSTTN